jgi:hypothetical protein
MPRVDVPKTARQRRRRNNRLVRIPTEGIKQFIFSARWISLSLLAVVTYALFLVGTDEHFYLTVIPVEGTVSIPAAEIVDASRLAGAHIFAADPGEAAARIVDMPGVINAAVTLTWPNHVLIEVQEDSPIAVWQDDGQQYWVTENGRLIPIRATVPGLLVIESEIPPARETAVSPEAGEQTEPIPQSSLAFIPEDVLAGAQQLRSLRPNIEKLFYRQSSGLSYQDGRGWRVYFGDGEDMHQKLVIYETITEELLTRGLTPDYISVSNQEKPYYRVQ